MESYWQMFTTTLGSAAVIAAITMVFYSSKKRSELHKKNKNLHRIIVAVLFGLLSIYASASAIAVENGALCNCRNLAPLYAGLVAGPIPGIIAALIGGLFRYFVYGGATALPCMLACFLAGIIGSVIHLIIKKEIRYNVLTGIIASIITEGCHMLILCAFGFADVAAKLVAPIMLANVLGMAFCLYIYKRFSKNEEN